MSFFIFIAFTVKAQNKFDQIGLPESPNSKVAFALRKLSTSYNGPLLRININSNYYDVYPDNTGILSLNSNISALYNTYNSSATGATLNALSTIISSSTDATVCIWYDQSGSGFDATQDVTANQPFIIQSGNIILQKNKPTITFNGANSNYFKLLGYIPNTVTNFSIITAASISPLVSGSSPLWCSRPPQNGNPPSYQNSITLCLGSSIVFIDDSKSTYIGPSINSTDNNLFISSNIWTSNSGNAITPSQFSMFINGNTPITTNNITGSDNSPVESFNTQYATMGYSFAWNNYFYGNVSELIVFESSLSKMNRQALEINQGVYYNIPTSSSLNSYGEIIYNKSNFINRNGAIGIGAINGAGQSISLTTLPLPITGAINSITSTTASSSVSIESDGGGAVVTGVCWGTTTAPNTSGFYSTDGGAVGSFNSILTSLSASTTYYVRSYATNGLGTKYGNEVSFTTLAPVVPSLSSTTVANTITGTTAISGGNVLSNGGVVITERGICWSNSSNPTTSDNKVSVAGTTGVFSGNLTNLALGITYYVRSYAINNIGTSYGDEISFTTNSFLSIGDSYAGGKIAYIFQNNESGYVAGETHGLIAASSDVLRSNWCGASTFSTTSISTGTAIRTGLANTLAIIARVGNTTTSAAKSCRDYRGGNFSDWYLPSKDELNKLFINKTAIGNFVSSNYWSSSQYNSSMAYYQSFSSGSSIPASKTSLFYVRPVRNF